ISTLSSFVFFLRALFLRLWGYLVHLVSPGKARSIQKIVFYSEGRQYWNVFQPILMALSKRGVPASYLTSDRDDPGLDSKLDGITSKYIGKIGVASAFMAQLKADFVGMTTPQLDVLTLKRSKRVKHYAHVIHAPADIFTYRKFAFDYFDSVFCSGEHQIHSIRSLEAKRGTKKKELYPVGCTYYDYMLEHSPKKSTNTNSTKTILIAPTWTEFSLLNQFGFKLCEQILISTNYKVALRPHPQTYVSYPQVIREIEDGFLKNPKFQIDREPSPESAMSNCDLMISDISGVIWDYAFLFEKPLMVFETKLNLNGFEGTELNPPMWEKVAIPKVAEVLSESDIPQISEKINSLMSGSSATQAREIRAESVFNWGKAGEAAADKIVEICGALK
ncbi:MAG: CDP-glycerol glycerophosphotransferase family protein, partial [Bdellovibrionales bacterium]|nr:CDP-glycerol glycerophosphotransferase family protein [Bdellovibrionales bacterium]